MKKRNITTEDQNQMAIAYDLLVDFIEFHEEIANPNWLSVLMNYYLDSFCVNEGSYNEMAKELDRMKEIYQMKLGIAQKHKSKAN